MTKLTHISKFFLSIVAVQIFNLSIYAQFNPVQSGNTMGEINTIDSVTEYIAEVILHHANAFPEFEKSGTHKDQHTHKNFSIQLFNDLQKPLTSETWMSQKSHTNSMSEDYQYLFFKEINPPPPKA
jgi:hypothetical protein